MTFQIKLIMKTQLLTLISLVLLAATACEQKIDVEKEKAAIIAVIEEETNAYVDADFDRLANTYLQDETCTRLSAGENSYNLVEGWETMGSNFKDGFENREPGYENLKFEKKNYKIKIFNNGAWATFDEDVSYDFEGNHVEITMIGTRLLEKIDGQWKIAFVGIVNTSSYKTVEENLKIAALYHELKPENVDEILTEDFEE